MLKKLAVRNLPLVVLLMFTLLLDLASVWGLSPDFDTLIKSVSDHADTVGFAMIVAFAVAEHLVFIGVYAPFSIVILVVMASTAGDPTLAIQTFFAIYLGQAFAYSCNIFVGSIFGNQVTRSRKVSNRELFFSCSHPQLGAAATFCAGAANQSRVATVARSVTFLFPWSVFWATFAYYGLTVILEDIGWSTIFYSYVAVVFVFDFLTLRRPNSNV